jgi:hypothetical protein
MNIGKFLKWKYEHCFILGGGVGGEGGGRSFVFNLVFNIPNHIRWTAESITCTKIDVKIYIIIAFSIIFVFANCDALYIFAVMLF